MAQDERELQAVAIFKTIDNRIQRRLNEIFRVFRVLSVNDGDRLTVATGDPESTDTWNVAKLPGLRVSPGDRVVVTKLPGSDITAVMNFTDVGATQEPEPTGPILPPGGAAGAVLKKASSADGDAVWEIEPSTGAIVGVAESTSFTPSTWSTTTGMPAAGWPALVFNTPPLEAGIEYVATIIVFVEMYGSINASAGRLYVSIDGTTTTSPEITTEGNVNAPKIQVHSAIRTGSGASIPIAVRWQYITGAAAVPEWAKAIVTLIPKSKVGGGGGGGGSVSWGAISGSIASQSDLQSELNLKANSVHTHTQSQIVGLDDDLSSMSAAIGTLATGKADAIALTSHTGDMANPHGVTKAQVGLGSVDNTSDAAKPVSTATQTALNLKLNVTDAPELIRDTMGVALVAGANVTITVNDAGDTITIASLGGGGGTTVDWGAITGTLSAQTDLQNALNAKANSSALTAHTGATNNPHSVTKAQVGLGNVDNTSDAAKPISTATQTALNAKLDTSSAPELVRDTMGAALVAGTNVTITVNDAGDTITIGAAGGTSGLAVVGTKITAVDADRFVILDSSDSLSGKSIRLDEMVVSYFDNLYMRSSAITSELAGKAASSHTHTKSQVGLANVDNTSDAAKPISTATQTALNGKAASSHTHTIANVTNLQSNLDSMSSAISSLSTGKADAIALSSHTGDTTNPHSVTKAQVGLSNVDNTSDAAKPISTATQTALNAKATYGELLDVNNGLQNHVASTANPHAVTKAQVGLGNVDNTSDAAKPISTATQTALNGKANSSHTHTIANTTGLQTALDGKAPVVHSHTIEEVLQIRVYNGGALIPTDIVGDVIIPYNCSPVGWTMVTPQASTAIIELWKDTLANYPPTSADKISSTNRINTAASKYGQGSVMTGWNLAWVKDEILRVYVASNNVATEMLINVYLTRTI